MTSELSVTNRHLTGWAITDTHLTGLAILGMAWMLLPPFFMKEPITWPKRYFLMVWYLGAMIAAGIYLVTR